MKWRSAESPLRERDVVAALHHARAAGLAEQPLHRDGYVELRRRILRMQRGEQPRAAGAEDEDIGALATDRGHRGPRGGRATPQPQSASGAVVAAEQAAAAARVRAMQRQHDQEDAAGDDHHAHPSFSSTAWRRGRCTLRVHLGVEAAAMAVHRDQQRPEIADAELARGSRD
jgi:hypothetical protein